MPCGALIERRAAPLLIAAKFFALKWIGVVMPDAPIREVSATSFQRGQMKNARSFFFAIIAYHSECH